MRVAMMMAVAVSAAAAAAASETSPSSSSSATTLPPVVVLTQHNFIAIRGEIDEALADRFLRDSMLFRASQKVVPQRYVFIDTPGGSVAAGRRMLGEIRRAQYTCIADRAYSMGFVLLQGCADRLVMPTSTLMQHPLTLELTGDFGSVRSYVDALQRTEHEMVRLQAARLGLAAHEFEARTASEWWLLDAPDIFRHRAADGLVTVVCAPPVVRGNDTLVRPVGTSHQIVETRSRCPLLRGVLLTQKRAVVMRGDDEDGDS